MGKVGLYMQGGSCGSGGFIEKILQAQLCGTQNILTMVTGELESGAQHSRLLLCRGVSFTFDKDLVCYFKRSSGRFVVGLSGVIGRKKTRNNNIQDLSTAFAETSIHTREKKGQSTVIQKNYKRSVRILSMFTGQSMGTMVRR